MNWLNYLLLFGGAVEEKELQLARELNEKNVAMEALQSGYEEKCQDCEG